MQKIETVKGLLRFKNRFLWLKKKKDRLNSANVGKWECPGGGIKFGETPMDALFREVREETGLSARMVKELPTIRFLDSKTESICHVFLLETDSDSVRLSPEHSDYQWLLPEQASSLEMVRFAGLLLEYFNNPGKFGLLG